ncbi:MAG TPA: GNAT family N-acetyltransferase [Ktedonobacterales bacterium]
MARALRSVSVRLATRADYAGFARVARETHDYHVALLPEVFRDAADIFPEAYFVELVEGVASCILLAERAGVITGYATMRLRGAPLDILVPHISAFIDNFGVAASARRHGVGRRLLMACRERARAMGADSLDLDCWEANQPGLRFYEAMGMRTTRRRLTLDL